MEKKYLLTLDNEFVKFCQLNNLDVEVEAARIFNEGFLKVKYGAKPQSVITTPTVVVAAVQNKVEVIDEGLTDKPEITATVPVETPEIDIYGDS